MRTTLKRGMGRGAVAGEAGGAQLPPIAVGPVTVYRAEAPAARGRGRLALQILGWLGVVLAVVVAGVAGGAYLYLHESVAAVAPKTIEVKRAAKRLDVILPGQPTTALVIGYDRRKTDAKGEPSRSDTLMLLRADPKAQTISLLSLPRDLRAEIICPGKSTYADKINAAYARCGPRGTLDTVRSFTGLPINYLITINFRGFIGVVDKLGGVWMDVDRRYFNNSSGLGGYSAINLQPGYQKLNGYQALAFVRFRHTDSDLYRNARQQLFVRGLKDQVRSQFSLTRLPQLVNVLTKNIEVGQGGGKDVSAKTVLSYALLAYSLPAGHVFQTRLEGLEGVYDLTTSEENIHKAVAEFTHPDVDSPTKATQVALNEKPKAKAPPAAATSVTVLNGNGQTGSASNANYLLSQRGYRMVLPANGVPANAPTFNYFRTRIYYDPKQAGAKPAARKVASLFGSADVQKVTPAIKALANGSMLTAVVGQTFHGTLAAAPIDQTPQRQPANVAPGSSASLDLLKGLQPRVKFPLLVPTVLERASWIDRERPSRIYWMDPGRKHKTVRLTFRIAGGNEYWGVQETDWSDAPVLGGKNFVRNIGGRRYEMYYSGPHLHMVVLRTSKATYWVVNSLLDRLSNETMIAVAKGLRSIGSVKQ